MKISTIDGYGGRFHFEPPVEVGDRRNLTLQTLAVLAFVGDNNSAFIQEAGEVQVGALLRTSAASPEMVQVALASFLAGKHEVTLV